MNCMYDMCVVHKGSGADQWPTGPGGGGHERKTRDPGQGTKNHPNAPKHICRRPNCLLSAQSLSSTVHSGFVDVRAHAVREVQRAGRMWSETWVSLKHDLRVTCAFYFFGSSTPCSHSLNFRNSLWWRNRWSAVRSQNPWTWDQTRIWEDPEQTSRGESCDAHTAFSHFISSCILVVISISFSLI